MFRGCQAVCRKPPCGMKACFLSTLSCVFILQDPNHPFRHAHHLRLTGIPTLLRWTRDGPGARIGPELESATTEEAAEALVARFVQQTSVI